jgi:hypothetical protein
MKVLVAGATGAIGRPLIRCLKEGGHAVFGLVRSAESASALDGMGAEPVIGDALDAASVKAAIQRVRPDAIVNELTSLPKHYTPEEMKTAADRDRTVRTRGNINLLAAMADAGVRRYLLQSSGFWYAPGAGLATETAAFAVDATPSVAAGARTYVEAGSGRVPNPGDTMRRSALWILLWARHLVYERRRYGRAGAPTACPDHRQGRGLVEFHPYRGCGRSDRGGASMRTRSLQYCRRQPERAARMATRICSRMRSSRTASGNGAARACNIGRRFRLLCDPASGGVE